MPNPNYVRGRAFEYREKKFWEGNGAVVMRTAGSHGIFDLIVVWPTGYMMGVQCKIVATDKEAELLGRKWKKSPPLPQGHYIQCLEVYSKQSRSILRFVIDRL